MTEHVKKSAIANPHRIHVCAKIYQRYENYNVITN